MKLKLPNNSFFWSVITAIIVVSILSVCSSCVTQKQRDRILKDCKVSSTESTTDSTWKKETIKYDTSYVFIPGPIRYFESPCAKLCDSLGNLKPFKVETKKNGIKQTLETVGNILVQKCDVDSLLKVNEEKTIEINRLIKKETETQIRENCKLEHVGKIDSFFIISGRIFYIILIAYVLFRAFKGWIKLNVPILSKWIK